MANRVVVGQRGGLYGLWASKPGYDVLTTSEDNMLFTMSGKITMVLMTGSVNFAVSGSTQTKVVPLSGTNGRSPMVALHRAFQGVIGTEVTTPVRSMGAASAFDLEVSVTSSNLTIVLRNATAYTSVIYYTVFVDTANG